MHPSTPVDCTCWSTPEATKRDVLGSCSFLRMMFFASSVRVQVTRRSSPPVSTRLYQLYTALDWVGPILEKRYRKLLDVMAMY